MYLYICMAVRRSLQEREESSSEACIRMHAYCTLCGKQYRALQPWHNAEVLSTIQAESLISDQALADLIKIAISTLNEHFERQAPVIDISRVGCFKVLGKICFVCSPLFHFLTLSFDLLSFCSIS